MRRFYAPPENFDFDKINLNLDESRHLREVLRLQTGVEVCVFDGEGREFLCFVQETGAKKSAAVLKIVKETVPDSPESDLNLTLAVALLKGEKFETVVQKAVELGVTKIVPLLTKRCDVKIKSAEFENKLERLQKIAVEAAKQCGRTKLIEITQLIDFQQFIELAEGAKLLFAERSGANFAEIKAVKKIIAVVGSEGGWEDSEIETARQKGFQIITFGGRILRAETAAISIASILQHRFGDLN